MINNRGFTLIEVLASLIIISLITILVLRFSGNTLSISKNEAYKIMKNNIYKASNNYVKECEAGVLSCNLEWNNNTTEFYVENLKNGGYFKNFVSPIDGKDIGKCIIIHASKDNGIININLIDNCDE